MIRIGNKINAHGWIFITDTAHFLMERMRSFHVLYSQRQMKFIFPQIIRFFSVAQPGEFQSVSCHAVTQINEFKRAVIGNFFLEQALTPAPFHKKKCSYPDQGH